MQWIRGDQGQGVVERTWPFGIDCKGKVSGVDDAALQLRGYAVVAAKEVDPQDNSTAAVHVICQGACQGRNKGKVVEPAVNQKRVIVIIHRRRTEIFPSVDLSEKARAPKLIHHISKIINKVGKPTNRHFCKWLGCDLTHVRD